MKKLNNTIYIVLIGFMFVGCVSSNSMEHELTELTHPILIVGVSEGGSVTLCDVKNKYMVLLQGYALTATISDNYIKGDTLLCGNNN